MTTSTYSELANEFADKVKRLTANYEEQMRNLYLAYEAKNKHLARQIENANTKPCEE